MKKGSQVVGSLAHKVRQHPHLSNSDLAKLLGVTPQRVASIRYDDAHRDEVRRRRRDHGRRIRQAQKKTFDAYIDE